MQAPILGWRRRRPPPNVAASEPQHPSQRSERPPLFHVRFHLRFHARGLLCLLFRRPSAHLSSFLLKSINNVRHRIGRKRRSLETKKEDAKEEPGEGGATPWTGGGSAAGPGSRPARNSRNISENWAKRCRRWQDGRREEDLLDLDQDLDLKTRPWSTTDAGLEPD